MWKHKNNNCLNVDQTIVKRIAKIPMCNLYAIVFDSKEGLILRIYDENLSSSSQTLTLFSKTTITMDIAEVFVGVSTAFRKHACILYEQQDNNIL